MDSHATLDVQHWHALQLVAAYQRDDVLAVKAHATDFAAARQPTPGPRPAALVMTLALGLLERAKAAPDPRAAELREGDAVELVASLCPADLAQAVTDRAERLLADPLGGGWSDDDSLAMLHAAAVFTVLVARLPAVAASLQQSSQTFDSWLAVPIALVEAQLGGPPPQPGSRSASPTPLDTGIPDDALELDAAGVATMETAATQLLLGFLIPDAALIQTALNRIDPAGERGYRTAHHVVHSWAAVWFNRLQQHGPVVRTSTLIPGLQAIIDRDVPQPKRTAVWMAYLPIMQQIVDHGRRSFHPEPTIDVEADLLLIAAYATWMAQQQPTHPAETTGRIHTVLRHLERTPRTVTAQQLGPAQRDQAVAALPDTIGPDAAQRIPRLPKPWSAEDRLLAAAYEVAARPGDDGAAEHLRHLHNLVLEHQTDLAEDRTAASKPTPQSAAELARRRDAERRRRNTKRRR